MVKQRKKVPQGLGMPILVSKGGHGEGYSQGPPPGGDKKKNWSFGLWWKAPKPGTGNNGNGSPEEARQGAQNKTKNLEKIGTYAKNFIKEIATNVQNQFLEPTMAGDPNRAEFQEKLGPNEQEDDEEEEFDEEEDEEEDENELGNEENKDGDDEESEGSEGYQEDEGSLDEDNEDETEASSKEKTGENKRPSIDNFAIDDDESPPIQHSNSSLEDVTEEKKTREGTQDKPQKKKTSGKGKGKAKKKGKKRKTRPQKPQNENLEFEDVYVNRAYSFGAPFTEFHQFYFKGDYLDYEPDEFFKATLMNEKTAITNLLFNEKRYLNIQDQVFYITKLEKVENYQLALVLESYPLSRLVRMDRVDKKRRIDIAFYTEDGGQNIQKEMVFQVKNYQRFLKIINQNMSMVNSSAHILSFNIE